MWSGEEDCADPARNWAKNREMRGNERTMEEGGAYMHGDEDQERIADGRCQIFCLTFLFGTAIQ